MNYRTYSPHPSLTRYIRCYWTLDGNDTSKGSRERIFPDGCIELIFHHGDVFRKILRETDATTQPRSFLHGQLRRYMEVESTGKIGIFSVRFQPHGLRAFLNVDTHELTGKVVGLEELWGVEGLILEERMLEAASTDERIRIVESFLICKLHSPCDGTIYFCVQAILNSAGSISIEDLSSEVNLGRRQLERNFLRAIGLSPKLLTRIIRFQNTLSKIENNSDMSLTDVAYTSGLYDQSHFIKDFKDFSGLNPLEYFKADAGLGRNLAAG